MKKLLSLCLCLAFAGSYAQTFNSNLAINFDSLAVRNLTVGELVPPVNITLYTSDSSKGGTQYYAFSNNGIHNAYISSYDSSYTFTGKLETITGPNYSYANIGTSAHNTSAAFKTYSQSGLSNLAKLSIEAVSSQTPYKAVKINVDATGSKRFVYGEYGVTGPLQGIQYDKTGYVTQLHSLTDKEYVDKNQLTLFAKDALPPAAIGRVIFVHNATGGACPAYSDGTNWKRFSDNSIIN